MNIDLAALRAAGEAKRLPLLRREEESLLAASVRAAKPLRILEVGTGSGYTAALLACLAPKATVTTIESLYSRWEYAKKLLIDAGLGDRVRVLYGDAGDILPTLRGPFDYVYLDGPKGHYLQHLRRIEPQLSLEATVAADNVLFRGYVRGDIEPPHRMRTIAVRMREFLNYLETSKYYSVKIYAVGDGLAVAKRKGK